MMRNPSTTLLACASWISRTPSSPAKIVRRYPLLRARSARETR
jgi:hypothetical protein